MISNNSETNNLSFTVSYFTLTSNLFERYEISGDMTSEEMTFGRLDHKLLEKGSCC